jgi:hypothetical protein
MADMTRGSPAASLAPAQGRDPPAAPAIAVLIPCYNEALTIHDVVLSFARALPSAAIFVYDNNSTDDTAKVARASGAVVRGAPLQGKGNVVRRMFADIEADVYLLVDGDGTYDCAAAPALVETLCGDGLDMVCAARISDEAEAYRLGHRFGNRFLSGVVRRVFGRQFKDMLTGYRAMSRRFVKTFPAHSAGFEVETELTVHALQMRLPSVEIETPYAARPEGSTSKLRTLRDGARILAMIGLLVRDERPLQLFSFIGAVAFVLATLLAAPVAGDYLRQGLVPRFPSLIVMVGLFVVAALSLVCGLILDTMARARLEQRRLAYLAIPGPKFEGRRQ